MLASSLLLPSKGFLTRSFIRKCSKIVDFGCRGFSITLEPCTVDRPDNQYHHRILLSLATASPPLLCMDMVSDQGEGGRSQLEVALYPGSISLDYLLLISQKISSSPQKRK